MPHPPRPPGSIRYASTPPLPPDGHVIAPCWCDRYFFPVPTADIRKGVTRSCGRADCRAPD